jgi:hypothetical protein
VGTVKIGATGRFPEGKITPEDEGELQLAIGASGSNVEIHFGTPVSWLAFPPSTARSLAAGLIAAADRIERGQ